ncbi:Zinc finger, RING/FYVE/PHD-type, partial [Sesbania bispinosa]
MDGRVKPYMNSAIKPLTPTPTPPGAAPPEFHRQPPPGGWNSRPFHHSYHYRKPGFHFNHRFDRPPERNSPLRLPNFVVELRLGRRELCRDDVESLIGECKPKPENFIFYPGDCVAASLNFRQLTDALDAVVWFWESRLSEAHDFTPALTPINVLLPADRDDLEGRLRTLFTSHVKGLMEGKEVKRWVAEIERLSKEIARVLKMLRSPLPIGVADQHIQKRNGLETEKRLAERRVTEFESAMQCILQYLEENDVEGGEDVVHVFRFDGRLNWKQIHSLITRERRRLEEGLPIYAYRRDILQEIHHQQITVLIGETGSGKSTQLVQFLADSGIGAGESIVCTQPRKIAAKSLAQRVQEESSGCYEDNSVKCYSTFSSLHEFDSRITFMTDHCLLQHYMSDKDLSGVSCIIIDEAHERSLNTDLLLALIKNLLCRRVEMRLIIMSATADAKQLSDYFYGCGIFVCLEEAFLWRMATEVHKQRKEGTILAFFDLTDRKLPWKRKVIFSTNLAETSLTIPGVTRALLINGWVVLGGLSLCKDPALGVKDVLDFDFVDAPSPSSIEMAIRNLIQLGVIKLNNNVHELTIEGRYLVRMGIEPRLVNLFLAVSDMVWVERGLVLSAMMANASSIFCRVVTQLTGVGTLICPLDHDRILKIVILSSLADNVAMYSGCNQLGYEVAQTGQHVQLHPSCSLLVFAQRPSWVVFGELLSEEQKLQMMRLTGFGSILLKRFCGKANSNLLGLVSRIKKACMKECIFIEVNFDQNDIQKRLHTECLEKYLYHGSGFSSPVALFGSGAEIKHLEPEKRSLSVDVCHPNMNALKTGALDVFEKNTLGCICALHKFTGSSKDVEDREKLHLEAAKALEQIEGKVLPGCLSWQKIKCQQLFTSSLTFPSPVYRVIKEQLEKVLASFKNLKGLDWNLDRTASGSQRVKITANATKTVAEVRRPLEELSRGKTIGKQLEIHLRGRDLPPDLMKQVVENFGARSPWTKGEDTWGRFYTQHTPPDDFFHGNKELKPRVEEIIFEIARASYHLVERHDSGPSCPICLCEVEDGYQLEGCGHLFCRLCLVEQCESAIKNQ